MKKADLLKLAGQYFISDAGLSTANLIRKIQIAEGHIDCYATGKTQCEQMACRWRGSCLGAGNECDAPDEVDDTHDEAELRLPLQRSGS
jgi:hypothetical protein